MKKFLTSFNISALLGTLLISIGLYFIIVLILVMFGWLSDDIKLFADFISQNLIYVVAADLIDIPLFILATRKNKSRKFYGWTGALGLLEIAGCIAMISYFVIKLCDNSQLINIDNDHWFILFIGIMFIIMLTMFFINTIHSFIQAKKSKN